jgi:hypothetical protein
MRNTHWLISLGLVAGLVTSACAEEAEPVCTPASIAEAQAKLPPELASWTKPAALTAATRPEELAQADVLLGQAVRAALAPTPGITYALRPAKPGGSVSKGGMLRLSVAKAGTYRIALSNPSWIDVVKGDAAVESIAHARGPDCSGLRKMVDFRLEPGSYVIQLSAGADPAMTVLVLLAP